MTERPHKRGWGVILRAVSAVGIAGAVVLVGVAPAQAATAREYEYWLDSGYGIQEAWQTTRGAGATIAIMDTGIGAGPADFSGVVGGTDVSGVGSSDGRTPTGDEDERNHGSWVASLAAGRGSGDGSMIGVAPDAELLAISIGFPSSGSTVSFTDQVADGIHWAVDNGADVINMSFSTNTKDWDPSWDEAFSYAFDHDVIIVAAAGNRGSGSTMVGAPATIPGVLTVAGVTKTGELSEDASTEGITIGVSAPSEELTGVSANGETIMWAGTSGASPIVAGMVALLRSAYPDMSANDIINRLVKTAVPTPYQGDTVPDSDFGYGYANVGAAMTADVSSVDTNPMGDLATWIETYRRADATAVDPPEDTTTVDALPPVEESKSAAANPLLPTNDTLRYISVPAAMILGAGTLVALGVVGATRHVRRVARK